MGEWYNNVRPVVEFICGGWIFSMVIYVGIITNKKSKKNDK